MDKAKPLKNGYKTGRIQKLSAPPANNLSSADANHQQPPPLQAAQAQSRVTMTRRYFAGSQADVL
jgi:hypothetical protein